MSDTHDGVAVNDGVSLTLTVSWRGLVRALRRATLMLSVDELTSVVTETEVTSLRDILERLRSYDVLDPVLSSEEREVVAAGRVAEEATRLRRCLERFGPVHRLTDCPQD